MAKWFFKILTLSTKLVWYKVKILSRNSFIFTIYVYIHFCQNQNGCFDLKINLLLLFKTN